MAGTCYTDCARGPALVESGIQPSAIRTLADLVSVENFKRILRRRLCIVEGRENAFNRDLAEALVQIGREWVKLKPHELAELTRLTGKMPMPTWGSPKRTKLPFGSSMIPRSCNACSISLDASGRKLSERKNPTSTAKAQAALGIAVLAYMPVRPGNLAELAFGTNLFIREERGAISSLELSAGR